MSSATNSPLGAAVRSGRVRADLTQAALAEAAGVSDETISRIERGAYEPAVSTLIAIADALGLTLDGLLGGERGRRAPSPRSPLVERLAETASRLDPPEVRVLLTMASLLAAKHRKSRP